MIELFSLKAFFWISWLLVGPAGLCLGAWLLLLAVRPEWTIRQRWSPINADRTRRFPWYLRLGLDPDTTPTHRYRLVGGVLLLALILFVLVFEGGRIGLAAVGGLMLTVLVVSVSVALASIARAFLPAATLERDSWITAGFPRMEHRALRIRAASLVTLLVLVCTAPPILFLLLTLTTSVVWMNPDLSPYEDFYAMTDEERGVAIKDYPLEEQINIYLVGELRLHHGSFLEDDIASNGAAIVPNLVERLVNTDSSFEKTFLLRVFLHMKYRGDYPVAADENLMPILEREAKAADSSSSDDYAGQIIERIRKPARTGYLGNGN